MPLCRILYHGGLHHGLQISRERLTYVTDHLIPLKPDASQVFTKTTVETMLGEAHRKSTRSVTFGERQRNVLRDVERLFHVLLRQKQCTSGNKHLEKLHGKRSTPGWADHKAYVSGAKGLKSSFPLLQLQTEERN